MTAAANRKLEVVCPSILQRERNILSVFREGNDTSFAAFALRVGGSASYRLSVSLVRSPTAWTVWMRK